MMRIFALCGKRSQELPADDDYMRRRMDGFDWQEARELATEVAPGVEVTLSGWGHMVLPDGTIASGAMIIVWTEGE